jgi:hypothetical protein
MVVTIGSDSMLVPSLLQESGGRFGERTLPLFQFRRAGDIEAQLGKDVT